VAVVLILVGILVIVGLSIAWLVRLIVRRRGAVAERIAADVEGATVLRGPENAIYRGGTGTYPKVDGNGTLVLTDRRLSFRILIGSDVLVAVDEIKGLREDKTFRRSRVGGKVHLIVQTGRGEVAFYVDDNAAWLSAIETARPQPTR
jgi:hypothetical protein